MSTGAIIWFSACVMLLSLSAAGIVFLQRTGRAGKYAWGRKDTKQSAGCLVQIVLVLPFLVLIGTALNEPRLSGANFWWTYIGLGIACGIFNRIVTKVIQSVEHRIDSDRED